MPRAPTAGLDWTHLPVPSCSIPGCSAAVGTYSAENAPRRGPSHSHAAWPWATRGDTRGCGFCALRVSGLLLLSHTEAVKTATWGSPGTAPQGGPKKRRSPKALFSGFRNKEKGEPFLLMPRGRGLGKPRPVCEKASLKTGKNGGLPWVPFRKLMFQTAFKNLSTVGVPPFSWGTRAQGD